MARVNVFTYPTSEYDQDGPQLAGWFNPDSATHYKEDVRWDGNNHISVNPVGRYGHQALYRTKGGRWVLNTWSDCQGSEDRYEFISDDTAKDWLIRNDEDDAVKQWFGELEEESGPNLGGRPAVGTKVETRIPEDILSLIDADANRQQISRAQWIRSAAEAALPPRILTSVGQRALANAVADLDQHSELRDSALDPECSHEERQIAAERYTGTFREMRTMLSELRDALPVQAARDAYAQADADDPDMVRRETAQAWARASAADALDGLLDALTLLLPVDGASVLSRSALEDPTADLD